MKHELKTTKKHEVSFFNSYHIDFDEKKIEARRQAWIRYQKNVEKYKKSLAIH